MGGLVRKYLFILDFRFRKSEMGHGSFGGSKSKKLDKWGLSKRGDYEDYEGELETPQKP